VSQSQVEAKRASRAGGRERLRVAQSRLAELDARLAQEYTQASAQLEGSGQELANLRIQYDAAARDHQHRGQAAAAGADRAAGGRRGARIKFENIDKDNFLLILAPVSGVITDVTSTQRGDKVQANTPLGGIAPKDARPMLRSRSPSATARSCAKACRSSSSSARFPYQRYGLIAGTLEYISPATKPSGPDKQPVYEGRVRLAQDYYSVAAASIRCDTA
jgi:HlyD family secretion protein